MGPGESLRHTLRSFWSGLIEPAGEENSTGRDRHREPHQHPFEAGGTFRFLSLGVALSNRGLAASARFGLRAALKARTTFGMVFGCETRLEEVLYGASARQDRFRNPDKACDNGTHRQRHERHGHRTRRFMRTVPRSVPMTATTVIVVRRVRVG